MRRTETRPRVSAPPFPPPPLCITRSLMPRKRTERAADLICWTLPLFSCEKTRRRGPASPRHHTCEGGNEWCIQGQLGKRRDLLCTDIFPFLSFVLSFFLLLFLLTFSTSYFQLTVSCQCCLCLFNHGLRISCLLFLCSHSKYEGELILIFCAGVKYFFFLFLSGCKSLC